MRSYTLGFIFDGEFEHVALMDKQRPDWQKGRLNGIGGKIEDGESSLACIVREVREESGLDTAEADWTRVSEMKGADFAVDVYGLCYPGNRDDVSTKTDEAVGWYAVASLPSNVLSNVPWLVHLCIDKLRNNKFREATILYHH